MKRISVTLVAAFGLMAFVSLASASTTPVVDARQAHQHQRIVHGVRDGQLTRGEARHLRHGQGHVRRMEHRAKADGRVTRAERQRLQHAQNVQSRRIHRLRHNGRERSS